MRLHALACDPSLPSLHSAQHPCSSLFFPLFLSSLYLFFSLSFYIPAFLPSLRHPIVAVDVDVVVVVLTLSRHLIVFLVSPVFLEHAVKRLSLFGRQFSSGKTV